MRNLAWLFMLSLLKVTEMDGIHTELKETDLLLPVTELGTGRQIQPSHFCTLNVQAKLDTPCIPCWCNCLLLKKNTVFWLSLDLHSFSLNMTKWRMPSNVYTFKMWNCRTVQRVLHYTFPDYRGCELSVPCLKLLMTSDEVGKIRDWVPSAWKHPQYRSRNLLCLFVYIQWKWTILRKQ
jgi:hypothetical protein